MNTATAIDTYCPLCGYNLRGAPTGRCSECGAVVGRGIASRIPWRQRRWRGLFSAWLRTAWLALVRPKLFGQEAGLRSPRRDPRLFFFVSMLFAVLMGTGLLAIAFAFLGPQWLDMAPHVSDEFLGVRKLTVSFFTPMFILWDHWLILIPAALTLFFSWSLSVWFMRFFLRVGAAPSVRRRRASRLSFYFSALPFWATLVLGLLAIMAAVQLEHSDWLVDFQSSYPAVEWLLVLLALLMLLAPLIDFSIRSFHDRGDFLRWYMWLFPATGILFVLGLAASDLRLDPFEEECVLGLLTVALGINVLGLITSPALWPIRHHALRFSYLLAYYPLLVVLTFIAVGVIVFWTCGFLAIVLGSLLR